MNKKKQGFTLIELLVVIAIIGLLSTLSILALNQARARARDAKRIADVKQIQTALELYYNEVGDYPASVTPGTAIANGTNVYLAVIPNAPEPTDGACGLSAEKSYTYTRTAVGSSDSYTLQYCLGATINGITPSVIQIASPAGIRHP